MILRVTERWCKRRHISCDNYKRAHGVVVRLNTTIEFLRLFWCPLFVIRLEYKIKYKNFDYLIATKNATPSLPSSWSMWSKSRWGARIHINLQFGSRPVSWLLFTQAPQGILLRSWILSKAVVAWCDPSIFKLLRWLHTDKQCDFENLIDPSWGTSKKRILVSGHSIATLPSSWTRCPWYLAVGFPCGMFLQKWG